MLDLVWSRPWALVGLFLPVIVLWLSLRRDQPRALAIGTFHLWQELPEHQRGGGRRRYVPPHRWLVLLALVAATLALAGPAHRDPETAQRWTVIVDPSPSMFLPHPEGGTRLDAALARLEDERDARALVWRRPGEEDEVTGAFPDRWRSAPTVPRRAPLWSRHDLAGTVWLTDAAPDTEPARAGLVTSGGPAVPGAIGRAGGEWVFWDGAEVSTRPGATVPAVWLDSELPADVREVVEAWRDARGLVSGDQEQASLRVRAATGEERAFRSVAGDWRARGQARAIRAEGTPLASWPDDRGITLVQARRGEVVVGMSTLELGGDPAAWAVDWSELCDRALAPPAEVVSRAERAAAGAAGWRPPAATAPVARASTWPPVALLAALAAGLLFLGLVLGQGRL